MLYVTTRNNRDAFTACHSMTRSRAEDGGLYVPMHLPKLTHQEISRFSSLSFGQCVAEMLNLFFATKLTGWDVDFSIGRYPVRLEQLAHKIMMAESWHNPDWYYDRLEKNLMALLQTENRTPGSWVSIAVRMAVLAGFLSTEELREKESVDISVVSGDMTLPISAWYLRKMGFPVGNIICCCNENRLLWDLFCTGQMRTEGNPVSTIVPQADVALPINLERLIADCGDVSEVLRYHAACVDRAIYTAADVLMQQLHKGLFVSVVSSTRVETTIPNVSRTHDYILTPASALAYSGLLDYRAKTGITRTAIVLCDSCPICEAEIIGKLLDISPEELKKRI